MRHITPTKSEKKREIKRRYAIRRRRQYIAATPILVALVIIKILLHVTDMEDSDWLPPNIWASTAVLAVLGLIVFSLFNWRCPRCNAYLGRYSYKHCSSCGAELR